jgi:hypothetical protein
MIIVGIILVGMFLFASDTTPENQGTVALSTGAFAYPDDEQEQNTGNDPYPDDEDASPTAQKTASPTPTVSASEEDEDDPAPTRRNATSTPRPSSTPTEPTADDNEPDASPLPRATDDPETPVDRASDFGPAVATETSTPTMTPEPDTLECPAEAITEIAGQGPPNTPLVLYFGDRPVGGGTTNSEGFYSIPLKIMHERTNETYQVEVRIRDNHKVIRTVTCIVPGPTPTP